jgi:hypothetical protein
MMYIMTAFGYSARHVVLWILRAPVVFSVPLASNRRLSANLRFGPIGKTIIARIAPVERRVGSDGADAVSVSAPVSERHPVMIQLGAIGDESTL